MVSLAGLHHSTLKAIFDIVASMFGAGKIDEDTLDHPHFVAYKGASREDSSPQFIIGQLRKRIIESQRKRLTGGLAHYVDARGKMMSLRLWVASRARAIRDHSQTESGRPILCTFPFETLKSCCVLGCFSGTGRDRTISFHRLPPINRPRLTKVLYNLRTKRVYGASTSSA